MSDEKTEEPTPKKLEDAKKKGESPKSQDINAAVGMLTATVCLSAASSTGAQHLVSLVELATGDALRATTDAQLQALAFAMAREGLAIVLPFIAAGVAMALLSSFVQVGVIISFEPLQLNFDKVNPGSGLKKLISLRSLIDFAKAVLKAVLVGSVMVSIGLGLLPLLIGASLQSPAGIIDASWAALLKLCGAATIVFFIIGPVDFGVQKWLFVRDQRMSKDDIKREHKNSEGDPLIKSQRKQLAQELVNSDPKARVPNASVVVTNPTHYAVALRYKPGETPLPVVVAKGMDAQALLIRAIAEEHRVPIIGNPPLARALHKVKLDEAIPEPLFEAVAAVLRWVATIEQITQQVAEPRGPPSSPTTSSSLERR